MATVKRRPTCVIQVLIFVCLICCVGRCSSQDPNAVLTSTESEVTLVWDVDDNATFYQVTWHRSIGFFFFDKFYYPPFDSVDNKLNFSTGAQLLPGVPYRFLLFKDGNSSSDKIFDGNIVTVPLPPESLEVVSRTSVSVQLTWEPGFNSSQDHYKVEYQEGGSIQTVVANSTDDPLTFNLTDLMPGRSYLLSMRAVSYGKQSNSSAPITAVTAPARPENLTLNAVSTDTLTASWLPGIDSLQDSFELHYGVEGETTLTNTSCSASPCQFNVGGEPGQLYVVHVYALQQSIRSEAATVRHNTAPAAPRNLGGGGKVRGLQLTWQTPLKGVFDEFLVRLTNSIDSSKRQYRVEKREGSNTTYSFSPADLRGGVNYFVQVFSVTLTEDSKESTSQLFFTLPESVSGLSGEALNTTAVQLDWENPANTDYDSLVVNLTALDGAVSFHSLSAGETSLIVGDLDPGAEYTAVVVVMSNNVGSAVVNTSLRTEPEVPQLLTVEPGEESIRVTLSGGLNPAGVYDSIQARLEENGTQLTADDQGVVEFQNLTPGTMYTLEAYTMSGEQSSQRLLLMLYTKPRPPQNLDVEVVTSEELSITWEAPDRGGVDNYTITVIASHGAEVPTVLVVRELNYSFTEAHPGETYNVSVVANKGTESSVAVTEQNTTSPLPLLHVRVSKKGIDFVVISWDTPTGSVYDGFAYDFPFLNKSGEELLAAPLSVRLEGLDPDSNYSVTLYVFSRHVDGRLLFSEPTAFNFSTYPESVAALQKVDATSSSITVNWTAPVSGRFRMFQLGVNPPHSQVSVLLVNASEMEHTFEQLRAGQNYTVAIRTVISRTIFGVPVRLQAVTKPLPVEDVVVETLDADRLRVSWAVNSSSFQDRFTIVQDKDGVRKSFQVSAVGGQTQYDLVLEQLLAGHDYDITVTAVREIDTDIEESLPEMQSGTTNPLPVVNLTLTANDQTMIVTWQSAPASHQDTYRIRYQPVLRNPDAPWLEQTAVAQSTQFSPVFPGEKYEVQVLAISNGQESVPSPGAVVIAPLPPSVTVNSAATTISSVALQWIHDPLATYVEQWAFTYTDSQNPAEGFEVPVAADMDDYERELTPLTAGVTYTVEVMAMSQGVMSEKATLTVTAKPLIHTSIIEVTEETSSSQLTFRYDVTASDVFDSFRFTLVGVADQAPVVKSRDDGDRQVHFTGLQGGQVYTVEAVTISAGVESDPVTKNILTGPNNVKVKFTNKSEEIVVGFTSLEGSATKYVVSCRTPSGASCLDDVDVPSNQNSTTIDNLLPYTPYTIVVKTVAGGPDVSDKMVETSYSVQTAEAAPSVVRDLTAVNDGLRMVELSWGPPMPLNGVLRSYRLLYTGVHSTGDQVMDEQNAISPNTTRLKLTALKAGYTYTFKVQAMTVALGPAAEKSLTLLADVPKFKLGYTPVNSKPVLPEGSVITESSLTVELSNAFSDDNGPISGHVVIVSSDPSADTSAPDLPSWSEAHRDSSIHIYQATENCSTLFQLNSLCGKSASRAIRAAEGQDSVLFKVGAQSAEECKGQQFCNGPLNAGTDYYVKLRAFTQAGFAETDYSVKIRTADAPQDSSTVIIAAVVSVIVVLVIIIVIVIFIVRRRRRPKRATKYQGTTGASRPPWESSSLKNFRASGARRFREVRDRMGMFAMHLLHINSQQPEESTSIVYEPDDRKFYRSFDKHISRPVKLRDFPEHVQKMAADSDFKYAEEYEDLKEVGRDQTCHAAELPANRPKNRFTNILPYDHSRVKLLPTDDEDGSDYINANYMPGFTSKREYIATQGPLPATGDDFWRMVWEQNARNIVMLTRCMEKGREKSDHYWPADSEPKYYGDLQVVILNETHLPDWTITEFRMCLGDNCRQVRHFHYKAWPDFGVPKNHSSLIRFVRMVREKLIKEGGPIVTHCSAGVGRSGTFIVLDHCLQLAREKDEVDIFSIVSSLRRERVLMVQTEQQYKFIHECLACVLEGREDDATYANIGQINVGFEDDEGINVEVPS